MSASIAPLVADDDAAGVGEVADHREVQFPLGEDGLGLRFRAGLEDHQHAFLAFAEHHLVGGHAGFALGDGVQREVDAHAALAGHLHTGAGEAGGAHVLDGDDGVGGHQLHAGLDEKLFREGVADLDGGALFLAVRA